MHLYYQSLPIAAAKHELDGMLYAYSGYRISPYPEPRIQECKPRLLRVITLYLSQGLCDVYLGCLGDSIAQTTNLPFSVRVVHVPDLNENSRVHRYAGP